jgi:hypothetical protein
MIQNITPVKRKPASVGSKINLTAMSALGSEPKKWMTITRAQNNAAFFCFGTGSSQFYALAKQVIEESE